MYENALSHYSYSLKYFLSVGDEQGASMLYNNLGLLFGNLKEFGKALVNLQMALQIKQRLKDRSSVASIYQSMAQLYYEKGDYARAIVWGKKSVRLSDSLGGFEARRICIHNPCKSI